MTLKAVPKVNTDGLYIEDVIADDAFSGVVPFYADPPAAELPPETDNESAEQLEDDPQADGYVVGVPVPAGLYLPRFDLKAWNKDNSMDPATYWTEGLTPEEIAALHPPAETTPTDLLGAELTAIKLQNIQQQAVVSALGAELVAAKLEIIRLKGGDLA